MGIFQYDRSKPWRDGVFLCSVRGNMKAEIIESKLRSEGIPCERRYQGSSNYMEILFGRDFANEIDIYVPEQVLEDAKNIIQPVDLDDCQFVWPKGYEPED